MLYSLRVYILTSHHKICTIILIYVDLHKLISVPLHSAKMEHKLVVFDSNIFQKRIFLFTSVGSACRNSHNKTKFY